ncbi:hypothetical protein CICLE_v10009664mg [Citrus x clementina]|uniref:Uncharacterized protein n=2 Tax=Citrus TaxID=2706 RepID=V4WGD3_CITCL|nr:uncharacterized protein LOC18054342 [Citrus x clementina]ESR65684.1 hypothetical protein CICLE_v10009664mg [Citrus x clementina]
MLEPNKGPLKTYGSQQSKPGLASSPTPASFPLNFSHLSNKPPSISGRRRKPLAAVTWLPKSPVFSLFAGTCVLILFSIGTYYYELHVRSSLKTFRQRLRNSVLGHYLDKMKKGLHPQMQWISYVTQSGRLMHIMMTKIHNVGKVYHFRARRQMAQSIGQVAKFRRRYEQQEDAENNKK